MRKFITVIAVLLISAGLSPAASSLFGQGEYGQYSDQAPPPPDDQGQPAAQPQYPAEAQPPMPDQDNAAQNESAENTPQNQQEAQADASAQPGVARASYIHGDVSSQSSDNAELVPVTLNTPLEAGTRISTANDARAEVELDYGDQLRLSGDATAKIAALNRQNIQVQVGQGLVTYSVLSGSQAQVEVDTPNAALHPDGQGDYRILVNSDAETKIIVRSGSADVSTPQGSTHVDAGQMITVAGTDSPQYRIDSAPGRDDWDTWNASRDSRVETAQSFRNTDPYYTGSEDLDTYGTWSEVPDYGNVWFPSNYGSDWAPYRDGSWVYEPYYGWTWVSYEPWGWAPYHYGRWFVYGGRWGWWPGPVYAGYYPVWAPAYVSFFGWGGGGLNFGFGFGGLGHVGWCPIGPADWYHPWYGRFGGRYNAIGFREYNNVHLGFGPLHGDRGRQFSNIHEAFTNDRIRSGISSMNGSEFGRGRVPTNQGRISQADFNGARAMTGRVPMAPSRASYSPTGRLANSAQFRNVPSNSQRFFSANRPSPGAANRGVVNGAQGSRQQTPFGNNNAARGNSPAAPAQNRANGWHTFTPPSSANRAQSPQSQGFNNGNRGTANQGAVQNRAPLNNNRGAIDNRAPQENRGSVDNRGPNNNGWHTFTPPSRESQPQQQQPNRNFSQPNEQNRGYQPQSQPNRNYQPQQAPRQAPRQAPDTNQRRTLDMRQPIAQPRGGSYGGGNAPRGNFSAPRGSGGGYSAPRGGGGSSAPRGGGGGGARSGGGGGHSGRR